VITPLRLRSPAVLAVAPFLAVLGYVVCTLLSASEDLDRPDPVPVVPHAGRPVPGATAAEDALSS
jgi:hypothetical protein